MKKSQFLEKIAHSWDEFTASFAGLSDSQLLQPGVSGNWSIRDILAHVSIWEEESLKYLPEILLGKQPPRYSTQYGGIDEFNALMTLQRQDWSLAKVHQHMLDTHSRLMAYLATVPDDQFATETRFRRRLGWDSTRHYPNHTQAILEWRQKNHL